MTALPRAILFDAYGTLLDVHSVADLADESFPGAGKALSALWRDKQLQYTWIRTLAGRYADFAEVTADALTYASAALGLSLDAATRGRLLAEYERLRAFPDAAAMLEDLEDLSVPLAVLSNGTPGMLEAVFVAAGLRGRFTHLLSVDSVGRYKTAPDAYQLAIETFGGRAEEFVLVSSNGWDVAGAAHFGFRTFWVNRLGAPVEVLGISPSGIGHSLADLKPWLASG